MKIWKLYNPTQWATGQADWIQNCMIHLSLCQLLGIMTQRYKPAKAFCCGAQLTSGFLIVYPNFTYVCIYLSIPKPFQPRDKFYFFFFFFNVFSHMEKVKRVHFCGVELVGYALLAVESHCRFTTPLLTLSKQPPKLPLHETIC